MSRQLSWLLRHGAGRSGLAMDAAGWASVEEVCAQVGITEAELDEVIAGNDKGRLQRDGARVRCCQGHSTEDMPIQREALEASWQVWTGAGPVVHGTTVEAARSALVQGIRAMGRTHVHLAESATSRVGKRSQVAVLLEVDPSRLEGLWVSPNGVILAREVPPTAIVGVSGVSRRGRAAVPELQGLVAGRPRDITDRADPVPEGHRAD